MFSLLESMALYNSLQGDKKNTQSQDSDQKWFMLTEWYMVYFKQYAYKCFMQTK